MTTLTPEQIDAVLPQTQCGLCGYAGCMPYAEALVYDQAPINLCPPGGVSTLNVLGALLQQDPAPYVAEMQAKSKPTMVAVIREAECIGCTLCIQACPVDSILGSAKQMHTVVTSECTGCELCISPCPVDCIDLVIVSDESQNEQLQKNKADQARRRFQHRNNRIQREKEAKKARHFNMSKIKRLSYIEAAIARTKAKKAST